MTQTASILIPLLTIGLFVAMIFIVNYVVFAYAGACEVYRVLQEFPKSTVVVPSWVKTSYFDIYQGPGFGRNRSIKRLVKMSETNDALLIKPPFSEAKSIPIEMIEGVYLEESFGRVRLKIRLTETGIRVFATIKKTDLPKFPLLQSKVNNEPDEDLKEQQAVRMTQLRSIVQHRYFLPTIIIGGLILGIIQMFLIDSLH